MLEKARASLSYLLGYSYFIFICFKVEAKKPEERGFLCLLTPPVSPVKPELRLVFCFPDSKFCQDDSYF